MVTKIGGTVSIAKRRVIALSPENPRKFHQPDGVDPQKLFGTSTGGEDLAIWLLLTPTTPQRKTPDPEQDQADRLPTSIYRIEIPPIAGKKPDHQIPLVEHGGSHTKGAEIKENSTRIRKLDPYSEGKSQ